MIQLASDMGYLWGILLAFSDPVLYGGSVIVDSVLTRHTCKTIRGLIIATAAMDVVLFLPCCFLLFSPGIPDISLFLLLFGVAAVGILYRFPFYAALRIADTSIVTGLFSLQRILIPVLAFFLVGEQLTPLQYLGFFMIFAGTLFLGRTKNVFRPNKVFWYMFVVAILLSFECIFWKMIFERTDWATGYFWGTLCAVVLSLFFFIIPSTWRVVARDWRMLKKRLPFFLAQGCVDFVAELGFTASISLIPVTIAKGIAGTEPFFVLLYAFLFRNTRYGKYFHEKGIHITMRKKIICFTVLLFGTVLILVNN